MWLKSLSHTMFSPKLLTNSLADAMNKAPLWWRILTGSPKSRVYLSKRSWKKPDWNWLGTVGVKLTSCCEGWHPLNGGSGLVSCLAGQGHSLGEMEPVCSMVIFYPWNAGQHRLHIGWPCSVVGTLSVPQYWLFMLKEYEVQDGIQLSFYLRTLCVLLCWFELPREQVAYIMRCKQSTRLTLFWTPRAAE